MKGPSGFLYVFFYILAIQVCGMCADDITPELLVERHLNSIGDSALLSHVKSITIIGTSDVDFILGMNGQMTGTALIVSQGPKMAIAMRFQDINYLEEYFAYDGKSVTVKHIRPGLKSPIADFLFRYNKIMKNSMMGGVFSNAWPLFDIKHNQPTMKVRKTRVEGTELYELEYRPKDFYGDMKIRFYFDPETYRHVRTEYKVNTRDDVTTGRPFSILGDIIGDSFYTLTEKFGDFSKVGGLTLPHSYILDYVIDGPAQSAFIARWKINALKIGFNTPDIDQKIFKAEK